MKKGIGLFIIGGILTAVGAIFGYIGEREYFMEKTQDELNELRKELTEGTD